jgi:hypothetical protein
LGVLGRHLFMLVGGGGPWIASSADDPNLPFAALQHYAGKSEASMRCGHRNSVAADPYLRISSAIIVDNIVLQDMDELWML